MVFPEFFAYVLLFYLVNVLYAAIVLCIFGAIGLAFYYQVTSAVSFIEYIFDSGAPVEFDAESFVSISSNKEQKTVSITRDIYEKGANPLITLMDPSGVARALPVSTPANRSVATPPVVPNPALLNWTRCIRKPSDVKNTHKSNMLPRSINISRIVTRPRSYAFYGGSPSPRFGPSFELPLPMIRLIDTCGDIRPLPFAPTIFLSEPCGTTTRIADDYDVLEQQEISEKANSDHVINPGMLCPWPYQPGENCEAGSDVEDCDIQPSEAITVDDVASSLGLSTMPVIDVADLADALDDIPRDLPKRSVRSFEVYVDDNELSSNTKSSPLRSREVDVPTFEQLKARKFALQRRIPTALKENEVLNRS